MLKKLWNVFTTLVVTLIVLIAISLAGARVFGAGAYTVLSGSMEPEYPVGSLLYVAKVPYTELRVGDPVTFAFAQDVAVTHRIVGIEEDENKPGVLWFTTKGDANAQADVSPLDCRNIIGRPVFCVPWLGYVTSYIQKPPGLYLACAAVAALLLLNLLPALFFSPKQEEKKE